MSRETISLDVLVLGSGLAGLRAALAAAKAAPKARIAVACLSRGAGGSSFSNVNNTLGMQVLDTAAKAEAFSKRVLEMAAPGFADPELVDVMAAESRDRFEDLRGLGVTFKPKKNSPDELDRHPACFARETLNSVVIADVGQAYRSMAAALKKAGVDLLEGHEVLELVRHGPRVCGAVLRRSANGRSKAIVPVRAGAVVAALGGPAPLFAWNRCGRAVTGSSHALLARAGARLVNQGFMQFMWTQIPDGGFWPVWELARRDMLIIRSDEFTESIPRSLRHLAEERSRHWPMAHGRKDTAWDAFLASRTGKNGVVELISPELETMRLVAMPHAGNGGALIDVQGRTTVPGLYAAGECASGMHGANRLGGAMILATQVFGARAGRAAARESGAGSWAELKAVRDAADRLAPSAMAETTAPSPPISKADHVAAAPVPGHGLDELASRIAQKLASPKPMGPSARLGLEGAGILLSAMLRNRDHLSGLDAA